MKKIEASTLEEAYIIAANEFKVSITALDIVITQQPTKGIFGLFSKNAIIVVKERHETQETREKEDKTDYALDDLEDDDKYDDGEYDEPVQYDESIYQIASEVKTQINELFLKLCYKIDEIEVDVYDNNTLLIKFNGDDVALLIGKEGYRYKAMSYILFNWINSTYQVQIRLEIAEFLQNQEESIERYLESVYDSVDNDGSAQTKILDGVLVQIALRRLRERYYDKYVAVRSTRDGEKYIIINDYHTH